MKLTALEMASCALAAFSHSPWWSSFSSLLVASGKMLKVVPIADFEPKVNAGSSSCDCIILASREELNSIGFYISHHRSLKRLWGSFQGTFCTLACIFRALADLSWWIWCQQKLEPCFRRHIFPLDCSCLLINNNRCN